MKLSKVLQLSVIGMTLCSTFATAGKWWEGGVGGIFNIPAVAYNEVFHGYTSYRVDGEFLPIYNEIDLQTGETMWIDSDTLLYDTQGRVIDSAVISPLGFNHELQERDGGLVAGAITKINVNNAEYTMAYAWSVNTGNGNNRTSGWIKTSKLYPKDDIKNILWNTREARLDLIQDEIDDGNYVEHSVVETVLPSWAEEYYLDPDRDANKTAGKAKYYYTRDGYLTLIKNIPETSNQRFGVGHDIIKAGDKFYVDTNVDRVNVNIYPPASSSEINHKLRLVWGYSVTSAGWKIYSWINERALN